LKSTMSNYSYNSQEDTSDVFKKMFPDSEIAQKFSCGKTKIMYLSCFGIAPHFTDLLTSNTKEFQRARHLKFGQMHLTQHASESSD
ncbi:MAG: hypothetical protein AAGK05_15035, partial [Pseudomonadota bacterium]